MNIPACPDCNLPMEAGIVLDASYAQIVKSKWYAGDPKTGTMLGLPIAGTVSVDLANAIDIQAFRCPQCGFLKSYAMK